MTIVARAWVSSAPQLLKPELNPDYAALVDGYGKVREDFAAKGVERIVYWSTQWLSVLGQMYQAGSELKGVHVDENWHDLGDLPFDFRVDRDLAAALCRAGEEAGFPGQTVDYRGFPVDTATIIADRLLNQERLPVTMVACNVYCDGAKTRAFSEVLSKLLMARPEKIGVVAVSHVTTSYHTVAIDLREDRIRGEAEQQFLTDFAGALTGARWQDLDGLFRDCLGSIRNDMGLKALEWLAGTMPQGLFQAPWKIHAKGALYGAAGMVASITA
ncbi:MAG: 2-aminophenol 1,6-dioxygenase subunit alpha [Pseudomonadota bacterium]|jgi:2-aminophenol/2-amino-5-chlorophenol 1,6-dioxygenase alpha subunit